MTDAADKIATTVTTTDDEKKRMRERVEALLKLPPSTSTGSVSIGKKALSYAVSAGFVPVVANMSDTHKGEADAALFLIPTLTPRRAPCNPRRTLWLALWGPYSQAMKTRHSAEF